MITMIDIIRGLLASAVTCDRCYTAPATHETFGGGACCDACAPRMIDPIEMRDAPAIREAQRLLAAYDAADATADTEPAPGPGGAA